MYVNMDLVAGFAVGFFVCAVLLATIAGMRQNNKG